MVVGKLGGNCSDSLPGCIWGFNKEVVGVVDLSKFGA
jgi:hypothetical protein